MKSLPWRILGATSVMTGTMVAASAWFGGAGAALGCFVIGATGSALSWWWSSSASRDVLEAERRLESIASGNFTKESSSHEHSSSLQTAVDRAADELGNVLSRVRGIARNIEGGAGQLASSSEEIALGAQRQSSSLQDSAQMLANVTNAVTQTASSAQQADQLAKGARHAAEAGGQTAKQLVSAMSDIDKSSRRIHEIVSAIDEIAFQTNLLALNAAVEAARAGVHGRGFAVVAGEVRNLAGRSAEAARETKTLIADALERVESGVSLVGQSSAGLEGILTSIVRVTDLAAEMSVAFSEQSRSLNEMNTTFGEIDKVAQENTAQTEELAVASESFANQAQQLASAIQGYRLPGDSGTNGASQQNRQANKKSTKPVHASADHKPRKQTSAPKASLLNKSPVVAHRASAPRLESAPSQGENEMDRLMSAAAVERDADDFSQY